MALAKNEHGLTPKQEKFAQEIVKGTDAVDAYKKAGYCPGGTRKTGYENSSHLMRHPKVRARIAELQAAVEAEDILTIEQIQAELTVIGLDEKNSKNVRLKALDQLAKSKGAYSDNITLHHSGGLTIEDKKEAFKELLGE